MELNEYQTQAAHTTHFGANTPSIDVALLGLGGEVGSVQTLFKKRLRDGDKYLSFKEKLTEELGDILWYLSSIAAQEGLTLEEIAVKNLKKTVSRWLSADDDEGFFFDDFFPAEEQLPREFAAEFRAVNAGKESKVAIYVDGKKTGDSLSDNAYEADGYRFHDVFHMTCAALLGWSPTFRALLHKKRKSDPETDQVEDGGRAIVIDEAVAALVFAYAIEHTYLEDIKDLDWNLLDYCRMLTRNLEVGKRSYADWERTILEAFRIWRHIQAHDGGRVWFDLINRTVEIIDT